MWLLRCSMRSSREPETLRSRTSFFCIPDTAIIWSRSLMAAGQPPIFDSTSAYWEAVEDISPIGEYFLKITSPSELVNISRGSPSRILIVLRISLGMTTRPKSSILLTIPVAFILQSSFLSFRIKTALQILKQQICQYSALIFFAEVWNLFQSI